MATIAEIRQKYPQYSDMSDTDLAKSLHAKHYSDMPFDQFANKVGLTAQPDAPVASEKESVNSFSLNTERVNAVGQGIGDIAAGAIRGAGSIGATILYPWDKARDMYYGDRKPGLTGLITGKQPISRNDERRKAMDSGLEEIGANPESFLYKSGKFGGELAGTAGVGGALAKGVKFIPGLTKALPGIEQALRTGGFRSGAAGPVRNVATRLGAGAATGGAMSGAVDFDNVGTGALFGAALPAAGMVATNTLKPAAKKLMQSAIKPTIEQLRKGQAKVAIDTLLDYGISPTQKGVEQLRAHLDDINTQVADKIASSKATVDKRNVLSYLSDVNKRFANQVSPQSDMAAISGVADDFIAHPAFTGQRIPIQAAQKLKQGTYKALKGKYGEVGSAATEAQKALARGLKENIGKAVPDVIPLNLEEQRLLDTLKVTERRALMELNKNPVGLSALASNPVGFAAFMADRSAAFKAITARMLNRTADIPIGTALANPATRAGLLGLQND